MTSNTVVLRIGFAWGNNFNSHRGVRAIGLTLSIWSLVKGVYEVIKKWQRGVGIREAIIPTRSLFM